MHLLHVCILSRCQRAGDLECRWRCRPSPSRTDWRRWHRSSASTRCHGRQRAASWLTAVGKDRAEDRHLLNEIGILDSLFRFCGTRSGSTVVHRSPSLTVACCSPPPISLDEERSSTRAVNRGCPQGHQGDPEPSPCDGRSALTWEPRRPTYKLHPSITPPLQPPLPLLSSFVHRSPPHCCSQLSSHPRDHGARGRRRAGGRLVRTLTPWLLGDPPARSRRASTVAAVGRARARGQARAQPTAPTAREETAGGRAWRRGRWATAGGGLSTRRARSLSPSFLPPCPPTSLLLSAPLPSVFFSPASMLDQDYRQVPLLVYLPAGAGVPRRLPRSDLPVSTARVLPDTTRVAYPPRPRAHGQVWWRQGRMFTGLSLAPTACIAALYLYPHFVRHVADPGSAYGPNCSR